MSNINVNDIVRIGKGAVDYVVESVEGENVKVRGGKGNRAQTVEASRLTVVGGLEVQEEEVSLPTLAELEEATQELVRQADEDIAQRLGDGVFAIVDGEVTQYKSFDSAAFAVSRDHDYLFASIVRDGKVLVKRDRLSA